MSKLCRMMLMGSVALTVCCGVQLAATVPWLAVAAAIGFAVVAAKRGYRRLTTLGSARWADADDLRRAGMLDADSGLILGRIFDSRPSLWPVVKSLFDRRLDAALACQQFLALFGKPPARMVRLSRAVHTAIFAPVGAGKSQGVVLPFLHNCPDACVVVDFKGELATLSASHRRDVFGHDVRILDPFRVVTQTPDRLNVLDGIDKNSPLAIDDCRDAATALVTRTGQEKDPHWCDSAEAWIAALCAVVVCHGPAGDRSLQTVRTLLSSNPAKMDAVIQLMCESVDVWEGMLARMGQQLTRFKGDELASTLTTTNRFLRFLDTIAVAESTRSSSFDPAELCKGKMTVYLVLPPKHMRAQSPLLRLWIGAMLRAVVRGGLQEKNKVHFILDESASLGHLDALDDAVDKYRGYGVRLQFYYQSLGQLKKCFPEGQEQTLLSNTTQVFFGCNDQQTAEYVSARLGEETIIVDSGGTGTGKSVQYPGNGPGSKSYSTNQNANWGQQARKLLKPEEVTGLPDRVAITFTPGVPPICSRLIRHYEEPNLSREPGWRERCWARIKLVAGCIVVLAAAIALTVCVTRLTNEISKAQHVAPAGAGWR